MKELLIALTNAVPGREAEFNEWYDQRHLRDVLALDGFVAAQRFELADVDPPQEAAFRYMAIYEVGDGQLEVARRSLVAARADRDRLLPLSDAMHEQRERYWYAPITERRTAG